MSNIEQIKDLWNRADLTTEEKANLSKMLIDAEALRSNTTDAFLGRGIKLKKPVTFEPRPWPGEYVNKEAWGKWYDKEYQAINKMRGLDDGRSLKVVRDEVNEDA